MTTTPQGLLFVFSQCEPDVPTSEFNDWYDDEHAPVRLTVPGITSATRYKAADNEKPDWLAIYDLATPKTTESPEFLGLRDIASEREKALIPRLPVLQRRTYSLITQSVRPNLPPNALPGKYLLVVLFSVSEDREVDFNKWYDEEHTRDISKTPGWLRARRYKLIDGANRVERGLAPPIEGWNYLTMHDFERGDYRKLPEFIAALETPWSKKTLETLKGVVLREFELHKNF
ncbi:hypothetical protein P691DRAFT_797920 [Macrolepiota fuliginosa MF-IS2]|uniref:Uncharacterized protein n=1 Tax=Macrolepiota fuliginosa MF-IS2 TaxID=1400762 RepID=A0A9P6C3G2_9AGAR|nr:hypothetical protein P691DRAFT_797920 [Macrolepiota fuliginosa MF-IS2]